MTKEFSRESKANEFISNHFRPHLLFLYNLLLFFVKWLRDNDFSSRFLTHFLPK